MFKEDPHFCCASGIRTASALLLAATLMGGLAYGQNPGTLLKGDEHLFPLGFYELPKSDEALAAMAEAGVNLVRCHNRQDLDRAHAVGLLGVVPIKLSQGVSEALRAQVEAVADHPALAVWEGPDEVVWNFTAYSGLHRKLGVHKTPGEWKRQTPEAVAYAEEQAGVIIPNMRAAAAFIRERDLQDRPLWINEALESDVYYVRQYLDFVDITGCDLYPVKGDKRNVARMGDATERWKAVGRGKPVYMVLQAFSWDELGDYYGETQTSYPSFAESRFMAYDVIAHGAAGILYWGSHYLKSDAFRQSLYALISELAALQPFLTAPGVPGVSVHLVEMPEDGGERGVACTARQRGEEWLLLLVNEDDTKHLGVVVNGLEDLDGQTLYALYGERALTVSSGEIVTRMMPQAVQVWCTSRAYEAPRDGRTFGE